jgi:single-strand DNA-binding protein
MARGLNYIFLAGTLTQAPELRYTPGGLAILEMSLGGNDHVVGDDDQQRELAWYHRVTVFGAQAESLANQLEAGTPVFAEGRLDYRWCWALAHEPPHRAVARRLSPTRRVSSACVTLSMRS